MRTTILTTVAALALSAGSALAAGGGGMPLPVLLQSQPQPGFSDAGRADRVTGPTSWLGGLVQRHPQPTANATIERPAPVNAAPQRG